MNPLIQQLKRYGHLNEEIEKGHITFVLYILND
ncbi:hypothetical protein SPPR111872_03890 [Sphingobacterium prati]